MRKPISHFLKTFMTLLLSTMAVAGGVACPNSSSNHEILECANPQTLNMISEDEIEMVEMNEMNERVTEYEYSEEIYDLANQNNRQENPVYSDNTYSNKEELKSSSKEVKGMYSYQNQNDLKTGKSIPSVVVSHPLNEKFSAKSLILPCGLIAAGVIGLESGLFKGRDDKEVEVKEKDVVNFEDVAQYVPAAAYLTLGFIPGIESKHSFVQRSMAAVTAYGMMFLITKPVKHWIHERRPDLTSDDSFPSGHAATSFTGAELIRLEYGTSIGLGAYALATTVSVLRITHNRHWFNDVVAGAGVGILCARASYWLLPLERKLFGIKDPKVGVAAFPIFNPQNRQLALGCCINF